MVRVKIFFRQYDKFGYITDNSQFGYRTLNDTNVIIGEKYVSKSGSIMLGALSKKPRHIDEIIKELMNIFSDVDFLTLKNDTVNFYQNLIDLGYISKSKEFDDCKDQDLISIADTKKLQNTTSVEQYSIKYLLKSIHIEISGFCNEKCVHCYIPHHRVDGMMDSRLFYKILEESVDLNIINITLSGGEPLLHENILEFLERSRRFELSVNILSNLTLLNNDIISEMSKNKFLSVQTSLYSMNPKIHDNITQHSGSFGKTKEGLLQLIHAGVPVQISCPIIKQNKKSFIEVIRWANDKNIGVVIEPIIFSIYDNSKSNLANRLSLEEIDEVYDVLFHNGYANEIYDKAKEKRMVTANDSVCSICRSKVCVSSNGYVFPCVGWHKNIIGNLNKQSLKEIWESSKEIKELREIQLKKFNKCISCEDRGYCTICIMNNYNENRDIYKISEFNCRSASIIHKKIFNFLEKKGHSYD